jgi:hypothetical protein
MPYRIASRPVEYTAFDLAWFRRPLKGAWP